MHLAIEKMAIVGVELRHVFKLHHQSSMGFYAEPTKIMKTNKTQSFTPVGNNKMQNGWNSIKCVQYTET